LHKQATSGLIPFRIVNGGRDEPQAEERRKEGRSDPQTQCSSQEGRGNTQTPSSRSESRKDPHAQSRSPQSGRHKSPKEATRRSLEARGPGNPANPARGIGTCAIIRARNPANVAEYGSAEQKYHALAVRIYYLSLVRKSHVPIGRFGVNAYELYFGIVGY
jgi:hypothetical protein